MWRKVMISMGLISVLLVLAACGGNGAVGGGETVKVTVIATDDMRFDPAVIEANRGDAVHITFENAGNIVHDLVIPDYDISLVAQGGKSATVEFIANETGTFTIRCTEPAHAQLGMVGELLVN